jgi:hypothetical protein
MHGIAIMGYAMQPDESEPIIRRNITTPPSPGSQIKTSNKVGYCRQQIKHNILIVKSVRFTCGKDSTPQTMIIRNC